MRALNPGQVAAVTGQTLTLCTLLTIVKNDGGVVKLTDLDVNYQDFNCDFGLDISDITIQLGGGGQTATATFLVDKAPAGQVRGVTYQDIENGLLDLCTVTVAWVDWDTNCTPLIVFTGYCSEAKYGDATQVVLSLNTPLTQDRTICKDVLSQTCRADFGDSKCKFDLTNSVDGPHVYAPIDAQSFLMTRDEFTPPGYYNNGTIEFQSGLNKGVAYEVLSCSLPDDNGRETLYLKVPLANDVAGGDYFFLYPGCDKVISSGCKFWSNTANFQGEPFTGIIGGDDANADVPTTPAAPTPIDTGLPGAFNWILAQYIQTGFGVSLVFNEGTTFITPNTETGYYGYVINRDAYDAIYNAVGGASAVRDADGRLTPVDVQKVAALTYANFKYDANICNVPVSWTGSATTDTPAPATSAAGVFCVNLYRDASRFISM